MKQKLIVMATVQDVQKKIDTKFKTLKSFEKDTPRIYERNNESELIKQKQLYEKRLDKINDLKIEMLETKTIQKQLQFTMHRLKISKTESLC